MNHKPIDDKFPIIALVCSTGGLDALTRVLAPASEDFPAAIIALQHLDPASPAFLAGLLDERTALPVATAADGDRLSPGRVWVTPPRHHTLITPDQSIALIESGAIPPARPSADLLLTTLALTAGPRALAVVLTGQGIDAATGATAIHRFGGTVLVASPDTSTAPSMPQATIDRDSITDQVVALDDVAGLLRALPLVHTPSPQG
ncbi:chemotaxis protein CheB [Actinoplanes sp. NPDC049596]|uniref:chemotaxis protein CheB n=1 Tax=unclassified Actinoplanes TaxID=2626549 RepID=UPI003420E1A4